MMEDSCVSSVNECCGASLAENNLIKEREGERERERERKRERFAGVIASAGCVLTVCTALQEEPLSLYCLNP